MSANSARPSDVAHVVGADYVFWGPIFMVERADARFIRMARELFLMDWDLVLLLCTVALASWLWHRNWPIQSAKGVAK